MHWCKLVQVYDASLSRQPFDCGHISPEHHLLGILWTPTTPITISFLSLISEQIGKRNKWQLPKLLTIQCSENRTLCQNTPRHLEYLAKQERTSHEHEKAERQRERECCTGTLGESAPAYSPRRPEWWFLMHPCTVARTQSRTCIMWGMASTIAPTSKSPMALERHRPPGHTLRGPHPSAVGPLAGPEPAQSYTTLSERHHHKKL